MQQEDPEPLSAISKTPSFILPRSLRLCRTVILRRKPKDLVLATVQKHEMFRFAQHDSNTVSSDCDTASLPGKKEVGAPPC
jgi:hypothetical protein